MEKISYQLYEEINRIANVHLYEGAKYSAEDVWLIQNSLYSNSPLGIKFSRIDTPIFTKMSKSEKENATYDVALTMNEIGQIRQSLMSFQKRVKNPPKRIAELIQLHTPKQKLGTTKQIN
jgi:hypothetical protein